MGMEAQFKVLDEEELRLVLESPERIEDMLFPLEVEDPFEGQLCLEKEWHAIHYYLTGALDRDGSVEGEAILGGTEVGPNLGFGPARLIDSNTVKSIADALSSVDFLEWASEYDESSENAEKVYTGLSKDPFVLEHQNNLFRQLSKMYGDAARHNRSVLTYLS